MKLKLILLTILSAVLMPLALPNDLIPYGSPLIGLVCLTPLFYALCKSPSYGFASILGMIFGALSTTLMYYWLAFFGEYSAYTLGGPVVGCLLFNALLAPYLYGFVKSFPRHRIFILSMVWVVYEMLKSYGFLGFPWGLMAHPYHMILPLIQISEITGIWGVSLLIVFINALITETLLLWPVCSLKKIRKAGFFKGIRIKWFTETVFIFSLVLAALIFGTIRLNIKIPAPRNLSVLLVQHNRDSWRSNSLVKPVLVGQQLTEAGIAGFGKTPELVVWSETILKVPVMDESGWYEENPKEESFFSFVRRTGTHFLVGSPKIISRAPTTGMNSTILITPEGESVRYYGKQHPVPMVEEIPFWDVPVVKKFYREVIGMAAPWTVGKEYTLFEVPLENGSTLCFGTPICFEDGFPDLNRRFIKKGADLLINLTNVSWSKRESAEIQMFVAAKFRSVETKRVLLRSTNSGVTSVIDPWGRTLKQLPLFEAGFLYMDVPVFKENRLTLYTVLGDWLPQFLFVFLIVILLVKKAGPYLMKWISGKKKAAKSSTVS